ncbi:hypothetical protein ABQE69_08915 [Mycolicibacillus trivialis]
MPDDEVGPDTEQAPTTAAPDAPTAYSAEPLDYDDADEYPTDQIVSRSWGVAAGIAALVVVLGAVVAVLVWLVGQPAPSATVAVPAPSPSSVTVTPEAPPSLAKGMLLDGTYRIDYDRASATYRNNKRADGGTVHWDYSDMPDTVWWAFTSKCNGTDCTATGVALDPHDHSLVSSSGGTDVMRFERGAWVDVTPYYATSTCTYADDGVPMGTSRESRAWSFTPLADGAFRGEMVVTVEGDGCGDAGNTLVTPLTVTRVGDVPPGVLVGAGP